MGKKRVRERPGELARLALQALASGDPQKALSVLNRARSKRAPAAELGGLLYYAYMSRAKEHAAAGRVEEERAELERASRFRDASRKLPVSPRNVAALVSSLPDEDSFALYAAYRREHAPHREAEVELANRLIIGRKTQPLAEMEEQSGFRREAELVKSALDSMDRGDWARAAETLKDLPGQSAFAEWGAFCAAMAAARVGAMDEVRRLVRVLSPRFPLRAAVRALRVVSRKGPVHTAKPYVAAARRLGLGGGSVRQVAASLRDAVRSGQGKEIARGIRKLAGAVDPDDPTEMRLELTRTLLVTEFPEAAEEVAEAGPWLDVIAGCIPHARASREEMHFSLQALVASGLGECFPGVVAAFIENLPDALADPESRRLARASVLLHLAAQVAKTPPWAMGESEGTALLRLTGRADVRSSADYIEDPRTAAADVLRMCVREDPSRKEAHEQLTQMLVRARRRSKEEIVDAFERYAAALPTEPGAWIGLAEFRLETLAYRKAEAALTKARAVGGRDPRIAELRSLASVVAAQRNLRGGRLAKARNDIATATGSIGGESEPIVRAWAALLSFAETRGSGLGKAFREALQPADTLVTARAACVALGAVYEDWEALSPRKWDETDLNAILDEAVEALCAERAEELPEFLKRYPASFHCVRGLSSPRPFLRDRWTSILRSVPDRRMFAAFLPAIESAQFARVRNELGTRLSRTRDRSRQRKLLLYLAAMKLLLGEDTTLERFRRLTASVPDEERSRLRDEASTLAETLRPYDWDLARALHRFDFEDD